ncbi:PorT family protein [Spirosoma sp. KCTC 42546]|uniref:outer membrane beta-barrel protein n=1 Tax=Spirosoma sp. KCTC 42546 TaxID=2520506 RepID=UPI00115B3A8F|nr:outer membrane beta-barrel protein [Spirosoma sp. KCTC 42546]QDK81535.1 PorT family protein [Spirosoma sp. KCTC 42546]
MIIQQKKDYALCKQIAQSMRYLLFLLTIVLGNSYQSSAQSKNRFNIGAGYSYSNTIIAIENTLLIGIAPIKPKPGFYVSLAYEHQLSGLFTTQLELNLQQKGHRYESSVEQRLVPVRYTYIGINPTIGVKPVKKLSFLIGPEVNLLISKSTSWSNSKPIEIGLTGRGRYQFSRIGITGGYFRAITFYDLTSTGTYSFTNQNWQVGLTYQLSPR